MSNETENDSWGDDYKSSEASEIQLPLEEDGFYAGIIKYIKREGKPHSLFALKVVDDPRNDGRSTVKNLNNPTVLKNQGKEAGAGMAMREWKGAFLSAQVKDAEVLKTKNHDDRIALLDGKKVYFLFEPAVLLKDTEYGKVTFVTKEKYDASKGDNGKRMKAYLAAGGAAAALAPRGPKTDKKSDLTDLD